MQPEKKLTDVHVHLDQYTQAEMDLVINQAGQAGVQWMVTLGMDLLSSARAVEIALAHDQVLAGVGIHPWFTSENSTSDIANLLALAKEEKVVAVGEVGLDYVDNVFTGVTYHDNEHLRKVQELAFRTQIQMACQLNLPLDVHCRGAYPALLSILREEQSYRVRGVVHNFDADEVVARQLLDLGFFISFGGTITYPTALELREVARWIPLDGFLLETDSPYMPLYEQSEEKNEPANQAGVARALAEIKGIDSEQVIDASFRNFTRFLRA